MSASTQALLTTRESRTGKAKSFSSQAKKPKFCPPINSSVEQISFLQRAVGNREVERLLSQTKLKVSEPGDIYEQEADRMSNQVLAAPTHAPVGGTGPRVQRVAGQPVAENATAPASVEHALASPGKPLEPTLRHEMEQRFGCDFSRVRVHIGPTAEQSARDVNARAYAVGPSMVFGAGEFNPETRKGQRLLAHELAHVAQQSGAAANVVRRQNDFDDEEPTLRERRNPHQPPFRGHVEKGGEKTPGNIASGEIDTNKPQGPTSGGRGGPPKVSPTGGTPKVTSGGGTPKVSSVGGAPKVKVPPINLSDYPPDRGGPVTRVFKDRPVLQKAGLVGGSVAAGAVSSGMMTLVESHFEGVLKDAQKEFRATFPDTASLKQRARIDEHRSSVRGRCEEATCPIQHGGRGAGGSRVRQGERSGSLLASRREETVAGQAHQGGLGRLPRSRRGLRECDGRFEGAARQVPGTGLPDIVDNVRRRAGVLRRAGDKLMDTFWSTIQFTVYFPLAYYQTFDIYLVARVFQNLGDQVGAFAEEISSRKSEYERLDAWLDAELINVGEQLNAPSPKRIPRK